MALGDVYNTHWEYKCNLTVLNLYKFKVCISFYAKCTFMCSHNNYFSIQ